MSIVAVTGGNGFTGQALVKRLLTDGYQVRALVRRPAEMFTAENLKLVEGDLLNTEALHALVEGAEFVMHIAAMYRSEGSFDEFYEVNVKGTEALLKASRQAGVKRFIYCSSIGVHGSVEHSPANEKAPFSPRDYYQQTKMMAEQFCMRNHGNGIEVTSIRPCGIYGPGDTRLLKMFKMLQKRVFFFAGDGQANFHPVYIDDLVQGFLLAMTVPKAAGEVFLIGGPRYMPLREFVDEAAEAINVPKPHIFIPYGLMNFAAMVCEGACAFLRLQPPLHRRRLRFFKHNRAFDIGKAKRVLGFNPTVDVEEGFKLTVAWYRAEGLLKLD